MAEARSKQWPTFAISQREDKPQLVGTDTKYYLTAVNSSSVEIQQKAVAGGDFEENQLWSKEVMDEGGQTFLLVSRRKPGGLVLFTDESRPGGDESKPKFVGLRKRKLNRDGSSTVKSKTAPDNTTAKAKEEEEELWMESKVEGVRADNNKSFLHIHKPTNDKLVLDSAANNSVVLSEKHDRKKPKPSWCWEFHPWKPKGNAAKGAYYGRPGMQGIDGSPGDGPPAVNHPAAPPAKGASGSRSGPKDDTTVKNDRKKGQQ